jgi:hypothetical protein
VAITGLEFDLVSDQLPKPTAVVVWKTERFASNFGAEFGRIQPGDRLLEFDGLTLDGVAESIKDQLSGANDDGKIRAALSSLSLRYGGMQDMPNSDSFTLKMKSLKGEEYTITLPWMVYIPENCLNYYRTFESFFRGSTLRTASSPSAIRFQEEDRVFFPPTGVSPLLRSKKLATNPNAKDDKFAAVIASSKGPCVIPGFCSQFSAVKDQGSQHPLSRIRKHIYKRSRLPLFETREPCKITFDLLKIWF